MVLYITGRVSTKVYYVSLYVPHRLYSYGEYKAEDQEQMLAALDKKVADVYSKCIGANEANIP